MKILMTGATGFVGRKIAAQLLGQGHKVVVLTRNVPKAAILLGNQCEFHNWSPTAEVASESVFRGVDGIINLMGENIATKRWSKKQKERIYNSRVEGTKNLLSGLQAYCEKHQSKIKVMVSTSAIGVYDNHGEIEIPESTQSSANSFLGQLCHDWEKVVEDFSSCFERKVILRVGVVLGQDGGALPKMLLPFRLGLGGKLAQGSQYMSWIHIADLVKMYLEALHNDQWQGIFNATAPRPVTNKVFTYTLGKVLHRPTLFPVPKVALKLMMGEMAALVLDSQRVVPHRAEDLGFKFQFPRVESALKDLCEPR